MNINIHEVFSLLITFLFYFSIFTRTLTEKSLCVQFGKVCCASMMSTIFVAVTLVLVVGCGVRVRCLWISVWCYVCRCVFGFDGLSASVFFFLFIAVSLPFTSPLFYPVFLANYLFIHMYVDTHSVAFH